MLLLNNKMNKKISITVGISALNEEKNIKNILENLLTQKNTNNFIAKIIVVSDGSSDDTVKIARSIKSKKIVVYEYKNRKGMTNRLNFMFQKFETDIFVKIDADLLPVNSNLLNEISMPFIHNKNIGLVGGKLVAISTENFAQRTINVARLTWDGIKEEFMQGNSFYSLPGGIYAISREFAKYAVFPKTIWSDVGYLYYSCKLNNFKYYSNKKALVYLNVPNNFKDYIKQLSRYSSQIEPLVDLYGDAVKKQFVIPRSVLYKYKAIYFTKYPVECLTLLFISVYVSIFSKVNKKNSRAKWGTANSSKLKI